MLYSIGLVIWLDSNRVHIVLLPLKVASFVVCTIVFALKGCFVCWVCSILVEYIVCC